MTCLFVCGFSSDSIIFHSYRDATIAGEELKILTRHSWPLSSGGSLACHTYSDTGHPFIIVISDTCQCLAVELSLPDFTTQVCCVWVSNTQPSACERNDKKGRKDCVLHPDILIECLVLDIGSAVLLLRHMQIENTRVRQKSYHTTNHWRFFNHNS